MKIEGQHTLPARREAVWDAVMDAEVISRVLPGCEEMQPTGENTFGGAIKIKVGPVQGKFQGSVELSELQPPESYHLEMKGKGAPGFVSGKGEIRLEEAEGGEKTTLHYQVDAQVGGRIASVGQRLLDSSARVVTRQALEGLEAQVVARNEGAGAGEGEAVERDVPAAPSQGEFAAKVAKGVFDDLVPPERQPLVFGIAALVLLAIVLLLFQTC